LFRLLAEPGGEYDPQTLPALAARFGCDVDFSTGRRRSWSETG